MNAALNRNLAVASLASVLLLASLFVLVVSSARSSRTIAVSEQQAIPQAGSIVINKSRLAQRLP